MTNRDLKTSILKGYPNRENLARYESGAAMIFVATIILPLFIFLLGITLDVNRYYAESRNAQTVLDQAALYGYRYLPFTEAASTAAVNYLGQYQDIQAQTEVTVTADSISLRFTRNFRTLFSRYFGINLEVPIALYSRSTGAGIDSLILMDTASYLGPGIPNGPAWADQPVSSFFDSEFPIYHDLEGTGLPQLLDPLIATQQCFNPAFSALKIATIRSYEFLSTFSRNKVGLGFFPAPGGYVDFARAVTPPVASGTSSDIAFLPYTGSLVSTHLCGAAAQRELHHDGYQLPESVAGMGGLWQPQSGAPVDMISPLNWQFDPEYANYLQAKETIWSRVVRANPLNTPNMAALTQSIGASLFSVAPDSNTRSLKSVILFAGDLPYIDGVRLVNGAGSTNPTVYSALQAELTNLGSLAVDNELHARLYYVLFPHEGNQAGFNQGITALTTLFEDVTLTEEQTGSFKATLLWANSASEAQEALLAYLALDRKMGVIAK